MIRACIFMHDWMGRFPQYIVPTATVYWDKQRHCNQAWLMTSGNPEVAYDLVEIDILKQTNMIYRAELCTSLFQAIQQQRGVMVASMHEIYIYIYAAPVCGCLFCICCTSGVGGLSERQRPSDLWVQNMWLLHASKCYMSPWDHMCASWDRFCLSLIMANMSLSKPVLRSTPSQCLPGRTLYLLPGGPRFRFIQLCAGISWGMIKPAFFMRFCKAAGMMEASTTGRFFTKWAIGSPNLSLCLKCSSTSSLQICSTLSNGLVW